MSVITETVRQIVQNVPRRSTARRSLRAGKRRLVALATTLLVTQALLLMGTTAPAQAHDCGGPSRHAVSTVSRADFVWDPWCSDGRAFIGYGSVGDIRCDGRAGQAYFEVFDRTASGAYAYLWGSKTFRATNGCGSWASFSDQRPPSPGASGWRLRVWVDACSWSCSQEPPVDFYG